MSNHTSNQSPDKSGAPTARTVTNLPAGQGAWDVTSFPRGGDFIRPSTDLALSNVRPSSEDGWMLGDAAYPPRKGVRTICFQGKVAA